MEDCGFCLECCLSLIAHSVGRELPSHEDAQTAYMEAIVVRFGGLLPTVSKEPKAANNQVSDCGKIP